MVPCYNEENNVVDAMESIQKAAQTYRLDYEILVVDDASADKTAQIVRQYQSQHPELPIVLHVNGQNRGLGYNYFNGIHLTGSEYYICAPGDNTAPPAALCNILEKLGQADMVIPYVENPEVRSWMRRFISRVFTALINCLSGRKIRYYNGPVLHKRENLLKCKNIGSGFGYQAEIICQLLKMGCTYVEVPFATLERISGGSSAFRFWDWISVSQSLLRVAKLR